MSISESVHRHPIKYLISSTITFTSLSVSIATYFISQQYEIKEKEHAVVLATVTADAAQAAEQQEAKISDYQRQISSVKRTIGNSTNSLDVRHLLMDPDTASSRLTRSIYNRQDRFYSRQIADGEQWVQEQTTELGLTARLIGVNEKLYQASLGRGQAKALTFYPVHLWSKKPYIKLKGYADIKQVFPFVLVQRVPHSGVSRLFSVSLNQDEEEETSDSKREHTEDELASLDYLEHLYQGDQAGMMLIQFLNIEASLSIPGKAKSRLKEVHKVGNVVYARMETTLLNVEINNLPEPEYILIREMLIVSMPKDLYVIKTMIPTTPEYDNEAISWINGWFVDFGIRTDEGNLLHVLKAASSRIH